MNKLPSMIYCSLSENVYVVDALSVSDKRTRLGETAYVRADVMINNGQWISVNVRKPTDWRTSVLVFGRTIDGPICTIGAYSAEHDRWWASDHEGAIDIVVTHWMPLPKPPTMESDE